MHKPTQEQVIEVLTRYRADTAAPAWARVVSVDLMHLIDSAWEADARQPITVTESPESILFPEQHAADVEGWTAVEDEQVERHNAEQRIRREAYTEAAAHYTCSQPIEGAEDHWLSDFRADAARRYPLRKRVPKVIPDPHGDGQWSLDEEGFLSFAGSTRAASLNVTTPRVRALAALLDDPYTWEEDTSIEEASDVPSGA